MELGLCKILNLESGIVLNQESGIMLIIKSGYGHAIHYFSFIL